MRVLIVEDNEDMIESLVLILARCEVISARSHEEALDRASGVDVALLDLSIGQDSGEQIARDIQLRFAHVRVILMSGRDDVGEVAARNNVKALPKPFSYAQLSAVLGGAC